MVFSRIRHNLIRGDFDRSANQQRVLRGIQAKVRARADEPGFLEGGVMHVMQYLHTDLPPTELFQLAQAVAQVDPSKITSCVVQGGIGNIAGASVVLPYTDQARRLGDRARNDATLESCDSIVRLRRAACGSGSWALRPSAGDGRAARGTGRGGALVVAARGWLRLLRAPAL